MSKRKNYKIDLTDAEFKNIKRNKQSIVYCLDNDEFKDIKLKDKIIFINGKKKLNKKVKRLHKYSTYEELCKNVKKKKLGYKKKEFIDYNKFINEYSKSDIEKYGVLGIEINIKKHILKKILLTILIVILFLFIKSSISNFITDLKVNKFKDSINNIEKEKVSYVFIEINPSLVLTIKDNKVNDVACLNDDCIEIYNDIDVKGKSIDESIGDLYNLSKEKGYDVSNGVKVKTTNNIIIKNKDYITIEYIDNTREKELLNKIKNNEEIKNINNDNYYSKLWEEIKKDGDYGKVYECIMNNGELECYIKKDFVITTYDDSEKTEDMTVITREWSKLEVQLEKIANVLRKFGIEVKEDGFIFNNPIAYITINGIKYSSFEIYQTPEKISYDAKIKCDFYGFNLIDINLLKPNSTPTNIILDEDDVNYNINPVVVDIFDTFDCSDKYCKKITQRDETKYICDIEYGEYMWREELKESGLIPIIKYEICDANKNNCRTVSKEYFNQFSLEYGNIDDLPECEKDYTTSCNDMGYCYVNNSSTSYCRSKINLNSEWSVLAPND